MPNNRCVDCQESPCACDPEAPCPHGVPRLFLGDCKPCSDAQHEEHLRTEGWCRASEVEELRQAWQPVRDAWADLMTAFAGEHTRTDAELAAWVAELYKACRTIDRCEGMPKVESDDGNEYAMWAQIVVGVPMLSIG